MTDPDTYWIDAHNFGPNEMTYHDMTYPGSKQPLIDYAAPAAPDEEAELVTALGEPYKYLRYHGIRTPFYSIGALARALNRSAVTIRKWEAEGVIPQPDFTAPREKSKALGKVRLYTREQIAGLRDIAREEGILLETWHAVHTTNFSERARDLFRKEEE